MIKKIFALLSLIVVICISFISYSHTYKITEDKGQMKSNIIQFLNRPTVIYKNIDIKQELNIDNKKYILLLNDNILGDAELTKGINNKYKIYSVGSGIGYFRDQVYKTNKGKYFIVEGKNYNKKIAYIKILLDNKEYKISIPQQYCMSKK
jgi:hypothetical protein